MKVEFYKHNLSSRDKEGVQDILDSLFLTTGGTVADFEHKLANYTGNKFAIGVTSCTDALFLSLKYFGVTVGDEVITTPMSFIATANAIEHCGATPVFVDTESGTGNIDINKIEAKITDKTKAVIPVHLYGQMCDMRALQELANHHHLPVIEDAAHCIEGVRDGLQPGQGGVSACYSFYATKNITCGEGGAITCNNSEMADYFKKARLHGMSKNAADRYTLKYEHYDMEFLGYKANMSNIDAALLLNQISDIDDFLRRKENISKRYDQAFTNNPRITVPQVLDGSKHARHLYTIWVDPKKRDEYMHALQEATIGVAVNFRAIHLMSYYQKKYGFKRGDYPQAEKIGDSTISLPLYPQLTDQEVDYVIEQVNQII